MMFCKTEIMKLNQDEIYSYHYYVFLDKNESSINPNSLKIKKDIKSKRNNRCVLIYIDICNLLFIIKNDDLTLSREEKQVLK